MSGEGLGDEKRWLQAIIKARFVARGRSTAGLSPATSRAGRSAGALALRWPPDQTGVALAHHALEGVGHGSLSVGEHPLEAIRADVRDGEALDSRKLSLCPLEGDGRLLEPLVSARAGALEPDPSVGLEHLEKQLGDERVEPLAGNAHAA